MADGLCLPVAQLLQGRLRALALDRCEQLRDLIDLLLARVEAATDIHGHPLCELAVRDDARGGELVERARGVTGLTVALDEGLMRLDLARGGVAVRPGGLGGGGRRGEGEGR